MTKGGSSVIPPAAAMGLLLLAATPALGADPLDFLQNYLDPETLHLITVIGWAVAIPALLFCLGWWTFGSWFGKLRRGLLSTFLIEHLTALARLGLPLTRGLGSCSEMLTRGSQRDVGDVERNLEEGMLLGDALARVPRRGRVSPGALPDDSILAFQLRAPAPLVSPPEAETLRIGEMSGNLAGALQLVVCERRRFDEVRTSLAAWFLYPVAVLVIAGTIVTFIFTYIVPKFKKMFEELDTGLPGMTQVLAEGASKAWAKWPWPFLWLVLAVAACLFGWSRIRRLRALTRGRNWARERVQRAAHLIPCHLGAMRRTLLAEFCTELAMLLRAGVPPYRALRVIAEGTMNPWFRDRVRLAAELCEKGAPLGLALDRSGLDRRAGWFSRAAGDPAALADSLGRLADDYRARARWTMVVAARLLPPVVIICVGACVAFVVVSVFLPLVKFMFEAAAW